MLFSFSAFRDTHKEEGNNQMSSISEEEYAEAPASKCKLFAQDFIGAERGELCACCFKLGVRCLGGSHPPRPMAGKFV